MPKIPTASRNPNPAVQPPTRPARKPAGAGASATRVRPSPSSANNVESNRTPREVQPQRALRAHASQSDNHDDCIKWLEAAEEDHQNRTARLNENCQQLVAEKAQLSAQVRQLASEKQKYAEECRRLKGENRTLEDSLKTATSLDQMPRDEYKQALKELQTSLADQITAKMNESDHVYFSTLLPSPNAAQTWQDQDANYLLGPSDIPAQPLQGYSSSSLPTIPHIDPYAHLP
ncbi:hypothetical protein N7530_002395 [Penicillium desertorum]|uniref:Uncharacterized protein n=1 Tax=Penicillium desertorum TaxID=1303715 RepID=A0A9W9X3F6_9EURO|nr:hypothetical protein N7530_012733 [Penicillium desertorum]KAJ5483149.1 hypothetical protein N7530_002395 [Penicillium desertorum]